MLKEKPSPLGKEIAKRCERTLGPEPQLREAGEQPPPQSPRPDAGQGPRALRSPSPCPHPGEPNFAFRRCCSARKAPRHGGRVVLLFAFFFFFPLSPLKFSVSSLTWLTFRQRGGQRHGSAHGSRGQRGPGAPAGAARLEPGPGPATPAPASPPAARLRRLRPILREPRLLFAARQSLKAGGVTKTQKR